MKIRPQAVLQKSLAEFDSNLFNQAVAINGVSINAQKVAAGDLFIACAGATTHGITFLEQAVKNGAVALVS